ncbi:(Fe-S)-binding protein, partial [bacterium]
MNPVVMLALIVAAHAAFFWSAKRRWQLLNIGRSANRFDKIPERIAGVFRYAFWQEKMDYYQPAGIAHKLIFAGFLVLLSRTLVLWGRGFSPSFNLFVLQPWTPLGRVFEFAKDVAATGVLAGVSVFFYFRIVNPLKRMTMSAEAVLILGIISTMMLADMTYDGAALALHARQAYLCKAGSMVATAGQCASIATIVSPLGTEIHEGFNLGAPAGSFFAWMLHDRDPGTLIFLAYAGFWIHATLPLIFLNLLPHSKHFHVITGIPNVFFKDMEPAGRLRPMAENAEKLMEIVGAAGELPDPASAPVGVARVEHFSWKAILDFYTCTECGRCSDNCPAHTTGKILSPKHLTLALRDALYGREAEYISGSAFGGAVAEGGTVNATETEGAPITIAKGTPINIAPDLIHPDVLWACTSCRACEEQCPVLISYVDKIVDMRRNLVMVRGEFPHELQKPFQGMEVNGNPWNLSRMDRAAWSDGLDIPFMADKPTAEVGVLVLERVEAVR